MAVARPRSLTPPQRLVPSTSHTATSLLLVSWSLLGFGNSLHEGEFSAVGLPAIVLGFALAVGLVARGRPLSTPTARDLRIPAAVCVVLAIAHPSARLMHVHGAGLHATEILAGVAAAAVLLSLFVARVAQPRWAAAVGVLALATGISTVVVVDNPHIDVWFLLQQSSTGLLHGQNMYEQHWRYSTGLKSVYPYLPGTTLLLAPFRWLTGDVRYGLLAADLLGAYLLRRIAPAAPVALAGLLLVMPHWTLLVDQSWTEPLLVAALAGSILALTRDRPGVAMLCLAIALACKQHIVLLLPLYALWPSFGWRRTAQAVGLAFLVVLPWILIGPQALWHDAVHANLSLGVIRRADCLPSLFSRWGFVPGFWFTLLVLAATYWLVLRRLPRTPANLALGAALVMWALDLANKQSFFNHYTLPMGLILVAVAAAGPRPQAGAVT